MFLEIVIKKVNKYAMFSDFIVSEISFELASILKNRSSNFQDFTICRLVCLFVICISHKQVTHDVAHIIL